MKYDEIKIATEHDALEFYNTHAIPHAPNIDTAKFHTYSYGFTPFSDNERPRLVLQTRVDSTSNWDAFFK